MQKMFSFLFIYQNMQHFIELMNKSFKEIVFQVISLVDLYYQLLIPFFYPTNLIYFKANI